jgi:hypothetical protein
MKFEYDIVNAMLKKQIETFVADCPGVVVVLGYKQGEEVKGIIAHNKLSQADIVAVVQSCAEAVKYPKSGL